MGKKALGRLSQPSRLGMLKEKRKMCSYSIVCACILQFLARLSVTHWLGKGGWWIKVGG